MHVLKVPSREYNLVFNWFYEEKEYSIYGTLNHAVSIKKGMS